MNPSSSGLLDASDKLLVMLVFVLLMIALYMLTYDRDS